MEKEDELIQRATDALENLDALVFDGSLSISTLSILVDDLEEILERFAR